MQKRYQVFVSSTFEDLKEERQKVIEALLKLRCLPAVMEFFVASDDSQWDLIKRVIDESDYYVVIVAAKYGSTLTDGPDAGMSYTEKEYRYARERGIPVYGFVHKSPENLPNNKHEQTSAGKRRLQDFRNLMTADKVVNFWETAEDLGTAVSLAIAVAKEDKPRTGWVRGDQGLSEAQVKRFFEMEAELARLKEQLKSEPSPEDLPQMAKEFLVESTTGEVRRISFNKDGGRLSISRDGDSRNFDFESQHDKAISRNAVSKLRQLGYWELGGETVFSLAFLPSALAYDAAKLVEDQVGRPTQYSIPRAVPVTPVLRGNPRNVLM